MTKQSRIILIVALVIVGAFFVLNSMYGLTGGHGRGVDALIARNVAARGGADAWRNVSSLQLSGQMDLGQGMHVPYVTVQERPGKMCLEFLFDGETAIQCVDGKAGWKLLPFLGRRAPESMTEEELSQMAGTAAIDGLLFDSDQRGHKIKLLGKEEFDGRVVQKLEVTLPGGELRWVYIDDESALEVKLQATRMVSGKERRVETIYDQWRETDGLLIARRQETRTEGMPESQFLSVDAVRIDPQLEDSYFVMPATADQVLIRSQRTPF